MPASSIPETRTHVITFDEPPANWSLPAGKADVDSGVLHLTGTGADWSAAAFPLGYVAGVRSPCYSIDFINKAPGSFLTLGIEGRAANGGYRRFAIVETGQIQVADAAGWAAYWTPFLKENTVYTADFELLAGVIELYVYEKGQARPAEPRYVLQNADWTEVRFAAWLYDKEADILEIRVRTTEDLPLDLSSTQTFDSVPYGWQLADGKAQIIGGELRLTGTGVDWSATAWPANTVAAARLPHYSIDFIHDTGFHFYVGLEGSAADGSYRRLAFSESGFIQKVEGSTWYDARMPSPLILGMEYTADFEFLADRLELYIYQRDTRRPLEPVYTLYNPNWTDVRFRTWLFHGQARIQEIRAAVFGHAADQPLSSETFDSIPANWQLPNGLAVVSGGVLNLSGTGVDWNATVHPTGYIETADHSRYSVEFMNKTAGSMFTAGLEGTDSGGDYRRFSISENGLIQVVSASGWSSGWMPSLEVGVVYTADFEYLGDRLEVYVFKKGAERTFEPTYVLRDPDWTNLRFGGWIYQGQAEIRDIKAQTVFSSVDIVLNGVQPKLVSGSVMTVTAATDPVTVDSYRWYLDGTLLSGEETSQVTIGSGMALGEHVLTLQVSLNGIVSFETVDFSVIPVLPAGWTRTPANDNFASRLFVTCSSGDPHCVHPIRTLKLMNLLTGEIRILDSYNTLYGWVSDVCDVSPNGTTVVFSSVKASPSTAGYWKTYVQNVNNPDQTLVIGEYGVSYGLNKAVFNGNETVTLFFHNGTSRTVAQWPVMP